MTRGAISDTLPPVAANPSETVTRRVTWLQGISKMLAFFTAAIASAVLAGWISDTETLKRIVPGLVAMNPLSAVNFLSGSVCLLLLRPDCPPVRRTVVMAVGFAIAAGGLLALAAILFDVPGVDQVLFSDKLALGSVVPNRMAPNTAFNFILAGMALLLAAFDFRKHAFLSQFIALLTMWISLVALIGYIYGTTSLYRMTGKIPMALHTSLCFIFYSLAILLHEPGRGLMARANAESAGGAMLRNTLPVIIFVPLLLGWFISARANPSDPTLAFALFVVMTMVIITATVWSNSLSLDAKETERDRAAEALLTAHSTLEARIEDRTGDLASVLRQIREGMAVLGASSESILNSAVQLTETATNTATAVTETTSTITEVRQTTQLSSDKAQHVAKSAGTAARTSEGGRKSTEEMLGGMERIREQMELIGESMVRLTEQSQAIGEIIAAVEDLSQQSNLLAVNAAIEAAKAGEQGKGFAVVAEEVKFLADQSKQATKQVRNILGEIQKASGEAVMATEQGSKAVEEGMRQSSQAGSSIMTLAQAIDQASQAAMQIAASSQQQLAGMDQVVQAMDHIKGASEQNVENARELEASARKLNELGQGLKQVAERYHVA